MKQYKALLQNIKDHGTYRMDRTGTGTTAIFGTQMRFDLKEGFPLVTLKKTFTRGIIHELLWLINGSTTNRTLIDKDVHIWDEWGLKKSDTLLDTHERDRLRATSSSGMPKDNRYEFKTAATPGDLGLLYGGFWRRWPTFGDKWIKVEKRVGVPAGPVEIPSYACSTANYTDLTSGQLATHWDNNGHPFHVLGEHHVDGRREVVIQFDKTKSIKRITPKLLLSGEISDPYRPTIYNVGCIGIVPNSLSTPLYVLWGRMMSRCYDEKNPVYRREGKNGFYVCPRWLCYENFFRDVKSLPQYEQWAMEPDLYEISPLYYGSNCYSPETAVFLTHHDIARYTSTAIYEVTNPKGIKSMYMGLADLSRGLQVKPKNLIDHLEGRESLKKLRNYVIEQLLSEQDVDWNYRRRIYVDQLAEVIRDIKAKPFSRRHIVTAWNPAFAASNYGTPQDNVVEGRQALASCHAFFQFFCRELTHLERMVLLNERHGEGFTSEASDEYINQSLDEKNIPKYALSCQLYQRSVDSFLGLPFNIASYALLTHMVAQVCNMVADEFVWTGGDTHIYSNHMAQVDELLTREPLPLPKLWLNPQIKNIDDFTIDDIKIKGYKSHDKLEGEVSI